MKGNFVTNRPRSGDDNTRRRVLKRLKTWLERSGATQAVMAGTSPAPPEVHQPNRARIFIMLSGCRHVRIAGEHGPQDIYLKRGDVLFCPRDSWHQVIPDRKYALLCIIFDQGHTSLTWKTSRPKSILNYVAAPCLSEGTRHVLQALETIDANAPERLPLAQSLISLAYRDLEQASCLADKAKTTHLRIREFMEEQYRSPINRDTVAQVFDLHPNHISRLFRQHEDKTFSAALTTLRLDEAARLLRSTTHSVKHIATHCGFESSNYFGKVFRRYFGVSPVGFRES